MTQCLQQEAPARRLVDLELRTRFDVSAAGRIECEAPPDGSPGPLMWLAGSDEGNVAAFASQLDDSLVGTLSALASYEPPLTSAGAAPAHLSRYLELLSPLGELQVQRGLSFHLPALAAPERASIVSSGTPEGDALTQQLTRDGMPGHLAEIGFADISDLWAPWRLVMADGQIAALAFAARLTAVGAELGLATAPAFRGRGLAAAATAAWSAHPALGKRTLFYSTAQANLASQRVAAKLGLAFIGPTFAIVAA